jgi:anti-sigma B factor antagonist
VCAAATPPRLGHAHHDPLLLVCTQSRIRRLFEITALDKAFPLHASLEEAIKG